MRTDHRKQGRKSVLGLAALFLLAALSACAPEAHQASLTEAINTQEVELAAARVKQRVPPEMLASFRLFLYVDKAESGPLAQRMVVFESRSGKTGTDRQLEPLYVWPVSTGREDREPDVHGQPQSTNTPEGLLTIDARRVFAHYVSTQWNEEMPDAMFLAGSANVPGLAIHAATGDGIGRIGTRASAGCIRLAPDKAHALYAMVRTRFAGLAPRLVPGPDGSLALKRDDKGRLERERGYAVLVMIENYSGETLAALH